MGKKIFLWSGVTLFSLTLALAGCGKKEEPAPPPPAPPPAAPGPETPGGAPGGGPGAMAPAPGGTEQAPGGAPGAPAEKMPEEKKDEGMKK
jgi:hypothetical protein